MAPAAEECRLLAIPVELRLIIYEHVLSDFKLDYYRRLEVNPDTCYPWIYTPWRELYDNRRWWALQLPLANSIESAVFFKQPLLETCQTIQHEALPLYIARLEQINHEAKSECERVVKQIKTLGESGQIDAPDARITFCQRELDRVFRTTMSLREAAM